jgi:DNA polymerase III subunit beta
MKITVLTANLQSKLSFLNHAVSARSQLPILLNMLIETREDHILIRGTDLEIGIEIKIPAIINEPGGITVPAKTFTELINSLSDDSVMLSMENSNLIVKSKNTNSIFQTIAKDEFPSLYEKKGELVASFMSNAIHKDLSSVIVSSSQDTTRPALAGVLVRREDEGFLLVATDGFRLSLKHYKTNGHDKSQNDISFIIPARVFRELLAIKEDTDKIDMYISHDQNQVLFEQGKTILIGRLIEATFPAFEKIIPSDFSLRVLFNREDMQKAIRTCSIFAPDSAGIIKLLFRRGHIIVSSQNPAVGENTVTLDAVLTGEENDIAFNARYLIDLFASLDVKDMVFEMTGPLNAGVFKINDDNSFLHLIMPIRVTQ